jgi:hypothetical protein
MFVHKTKRPAINLHIQDELHIAVCWVQIFSCVGILILG